MVIYRLAGRPRAEVRAICEVTEGAGIEVRRGRGVERLGRVRSLAVTDAGWTVGIDELDDDGVERTIERTIPFEDLVALVPGAWPSEPTD